MIKSVTISLLVISCFSRVVSQNEVKKWYFGKGAALDFMSNPPVALNNNAMLPPSPPGFNEGSSSIADATGNLLFYTDGVTVWNQSHSVMLNGSGLLGNLSTSQSALIVQKPTSTNLYYIFTLDAAGGSGGLRYSIVDMSLAAGMGSVTAKNVLIYTPSAEKLCGVRHCNGTDVWIVTHEYPGSNFRAYLLTSAGVNTTAPVLSSVGTNINNTGITQGCMKISPTGKKLGLAIYYINTGSAFELYDFDNTTGVVSNSLVLPSATQGYGCEFSPDGTKFYGSAGYGSGKILQWDLCAGSGTAVIASQYTMAATGAGQMQLAADGKIYVARLNQQTMGVIGNPNTAGPACNYNDLGQSVSTGTCSHGTPNFMSSFFKQMPLPFTYTVAPVVSCQTFSFTAPAISTLSSSCSASAPPYTSFSWNFGDPASGSSNTSTLSNPLHSFSSVGFFQVKLILNTACAADTIKQSVAVSSFSITSSAPGTVCPGQTVTLSCTGANSYTWSTASTASFTTVNPTVTTTYSVTGGNAPSCSTASAVTVQVYTTSLSISPASPNTVCPGQAIILTAGGAGSYTWSGSQVTSTISVTPTVTSSYTVNAGFGLNCLASLVVSVPVYSHSFSAAGPATLCAGQPATLTAGGVNTYSWSSSQTSASIIVTPSLTSSYSVTGGYGLNCSTSSVITISVSPVPFMSVTGPFTVCPNEKRIYTAGGAANYSWTTNATTSTIAISHGTAGSYTYAVTGTNSLNCSSTKIFTVVVNECTGIEELEDLRGISVFPNPVAGETLVIKTGESSVLRLYDLNGALLIREQLVSGKNFINIASLTPGIYLLKIEGDSGIKVSRFVRAKG